MMISYVFAVVFRRVAFSLIEICYCICTITTIKLVFAWTTRKSIIAPSAIQIVITAAVNQSITTIVSIQSILTATAGNSVALGCSVAGLGWPTLYISCQCFHCNIWNKAC
jgi:hypothetical protein